MPHSTGFSDVDNSARADELIGYLGHVATQLAAIRALDFDRLRLVPGDAVLDVGCGAGEVCVELARRVGPGGRVCGVDLSEAMVEAARAAAKAAGVTVEHRVASVHALPFPDATFDAVRAERVFQHIQEPAQALAEMIRVTRPGGRVMVIDPDHSQWAMSVESPLQTRVAEAVREQLLAAIANPRIGTRLRGLFVTAGLVGTDLAIRAIDMDWPTYVQATFHARSLESAVEAGHLTAAEVDEFRADMERMDAAGRFMATAVGYAMLGTRPGGP